MKLKENQDLQVNGKYTFFHINGLAMTTRKEIKIKGKDEKGFIYAEKSKRKKYYLPTDEDILIFAGWNLPIKSDMQTNYFRGNACFNIVGESLKDVKHFIETYNLCEITEDSKAKFLFIPFADLKTLQEQLVYPDIFTTHAVIQGLKEGNR